MPLPTCTSLPELSCDTGGSLANTDIQHSSALWVYSTSALWVYSNSALWVYSTSTLWDFCHL